MTTAANNIKEIDAETVEPNKYNIAMTILEQDAASGEGLVLRYQDYDDTMSRLQFSDFAQGVSSVSKMMAILNVYRPELFDKIMATIEEPTELVPSGPRAAEASHTASGPAALTAAASSVRS